MKTALGVVLCLLLFCLSTAHGQDAEIIDLTTKPIKHKNTHNLTASARGFATSQGHSNKNKNAPFKLELLNVDSQSYTVGEQIIYEVQLENITDNPIVIPCSLDLDAVKPNETSEPNGYLEAFISLVFKDEIWGDQFIASQVLYGSNLLSGSLKNLLPGQKVILRVSGNLEFMNADVVQRMRQKLPSAFEIRARFGMLSNISSLSSIPAMSPNSLNLVFNKRQ